MGRWQWVLLISELFLFALILVLPQVDLPDTTFRDGTAPVVAHAQLNAPPPAAVTRIALAVRSLGDAGSLVTGTLPPVSLLSSLERRLLVCALLC